MSKLRCVMTSMCLHRRKHAATWTGGRTICSSVRFSPSGGGAASAIIVTPSNILESFVDLFPPVGGPLQNRPTFDWQHVYLIRCANSQRNSLYPLRCRCKPQSHPTQAVSTLCWNTPAVFDLVYGGSGAKFCHVGRLYAIPGLPQPAQGTGRVTNLMDYCRCICPSFVPWCRRASLGLSGKSRSTPMKDGGGVGGWRFQQPTYLADHSTPRGPPDRMLSMSNIAGVDHGGLWTQAPMCALSRKSDRSNVSSRQQAWKNSDSSSLHNAPERNCVGLLVLQREECLYIAVVFCVHNPWEDPMKHPFKRGLQMKSDLLSSQCFAFTHEPLRLSMEEVLSYHAKVEEVSRSKAALRAKKRSRSSSKVEALMSLPLLLNRTLLIAVDGSADHTPLHCGTTPSAIAVQSVPELLRHYRCCQVEQLMQQNCTWISGRYQRKDHSLAVVDVEHLLQYQREHLTRKGGRHRCHSRNRTVVCSPLPPSSVLLRKRPSIAQPHKLAEELRYGKIVVFDCSQIYR